MDESEAAAYTADYDDNGSPSKSNENDDDDDDDYEKNDEVFQDEADAGSLEMQPLQKEGSLKQQQHQPQQGSDGLFHDRHGHPQQPGGLWSGLNDFLYPPIYHDRVNCYEKKTLPSLSAICWWACCRVSRRRSLMSFPLIWAPRKRNKPR